MMGQHAHSESLFYYFRLDDQVPENHLLRLVDKHIDFGFVRERLKDSYSDTGRPSIDPELLLRVLLIGYLYGISSERKFVEELLLLFKLCGTLLCSLFGAPIADQGVKRCGDGTSRGNMKLRALPRISRITPGTILCQII